jgi:type IV pilus assembly protein PilA
MFSYKEKTKSGFSLIELMIVIAIIGILAAIAVPAYTDYMARSRVVELVNASDLLRKAFSEFRMVKGNFTVSATPFTDLGVTDPSNTGNIAGVTIGGNATNGVIKICGNSTGLGIGTDTAGIVLVGSYSNNSVAWTCQSTGTNSAKYVPTSCRTTYAATAGVAVGCP